MNKYFIQHRLHTLAKSYVNLNEQQASFELDKIKFSHWDPNSTDTKKTSYWLLENEVIASNYRNAITSFNRKITSILSRLAFLSQCYTEYLREPYLLYKEGSNVVFFRYTTQVDGVPLSFDKGSLKGLQYLQDEQDINSEFFYYWNDMLNVTGYSAKLLLLCSALEALAKSPLNSHGKQGKHVFFTEILGEQLKNKLFQQNKGIRHRLTHGEYFNEDTDHDNYLKEVYERLISHFNDKIFKEPLIRHVINPQRHPDGNKRGGYYFLEIKKDSQQFDLINLVKGCDDDFHNYMNQFNSIDPPQNY